MYKPFAVLFCLIASASAHFRLLYPGPRGVFVANDEPEFCANRPEVTTNRTAFPLSGGYINIKTGHPNWAAGVLISTDPNPNTWDKFNIPGTSNVQYIKDFGKQADPGTFCIPVEMQGSNITGIQEGANVTIQVVFSGGDGNLYQCADLTLSATATTPSDQPCTNTTDTAAVSSISAASASSAAAASQTAKSGATSISPGVSILFTLFAAAAVTISL